MGVICRVRPYMRCGFSTFLTLEDHGGVTMVDRSMALGVSAFLRDPDRAQVCRIDQAHGSRRPEAQRAPGEGRTDGLGRKALAVRPGGQHPSAFGRSTQSWLNLSFVVDKPDLADKSARVLLAAHPIAAPPQRPVPDVTQQPRPN